MEWGGVGWAWLGGLVGAAGRAGGLKAAGKGSPPYCTHESARDWLWELVHCAPLLLLLLPLLFPLPTRLLPLPCLNPLPWRSTSSKS